MDKEMNKLKRCITNKNTMRLNGKKIKRIRIDWNRKVKPYTKAQVLVLFITGLLTALIFLYL